MHEGGFPPEFVFFCWIMSCDVFLSTSPEKWHFIPDVTAIRYSYCDEAAVSQFKG